MANEKRLIDANALDNELNTLMIRFHAMGRDNVVKDYNFVRTVLETAPTVDVVEVVHGRWIHDYNNLYGCSECMERETMSPKKLKNYCPNCGAKMDGDGNV